MSAALPLRRAWSTVISAFASENSIRSFTESGEKPPNTTLCGAPMRAGEHRHGHLGDHRQVDAHHVARLDAAVLQHVGEPLHVARSSA